MRFFLFSCALCFSAMAQPFGAGLKVGAPLTDAVSLVSSGAPDQTVSTNRYVIGPYGEVRLPGGFSVEVDALYRSFSYFQGAPNGNGASGSNGSWEFPVMAKEKLLKGPVRPYIAGGLVLSHLTGSDLDVTHASNYGVTVGAGVDIHALVLHLTPEIRYDGFVFHDFTSNSFVQSNRNQVLFLVGIGF